MLRASKDDIKWCAGMLAERDRAREEHGEVYDDIVHVAAVVSEEAGELIQAVLNYEYHGGSLEQVELEAYHTGATVLRMLERCTKK